MPHDPSVAVRRRHLPSEAGEENVGASKCECPARLQGRNMMEYDSHVPVFALMSATSWADTFFFCVKILFSSCQPTNGVETSPYWS